MTRRLAHVIVGAAGEAADPVGISDPAGKRDHRQLRVDTRGEPVGGPHPIEKLEPAAVLEPQVEHYEARLTHLDGAHALLRAARAGDPEAVRRKVVEQERARGVVILNHQDQPLVIHTRRRAASEKLAPAACRTRAREGGRD
jgi:hypothetical protein